MRLIWLGLLLIDPHLVGRRDGRGGQRAGHAPRSSASELLFPMLLGFALLVIWKHRENIRPPEGRNRAAHRERRLERRPGRPAAADPLARHRAGHLSPVARRASAAPSAALAAVPDLAAARRRHGRRACSAASDAEREIARVEALGARYLALGQGLYPRAARRARRCAAAADRPRATSGCSTGRWWRSSARATRRRRRAASPAGWRMISASRARSSSPAWPAGSTARRMTARWTAARSASSPAGIDIFYPPENEERQEAMFERGLVLAEMPPGTEPRARHFPYRNRIIAGPGARHGGGRGGAAIGLADHRAAGGRGRARGDGGARLAARSARAGLQPADPRRRDAGPDRRRRDGSDAAARRPRCASPRARLRAGRAAAGSTATLARSASVEELLGPSPVPVDEIVRLSGAPSGAVQMVLLELDLAGRLDRHAGGKVSLAARLTGRIRRPHHTRMREGNSIETCRRRIAGQGENHRKISRAGAPRARQLRPCPRSAAQGRLGRSGRRLRDAVGDLARQGRSS